MSSTMSPEFPAPSEVLATGSFADVSAGALAVLVGDAEVERRRQAARLCSVLGAAEEAGCWRGSHYRSITQWVRANLGWSEGDCRRYLAVARAGRRYPDVIESLAEGDIAVEHAAALSRHLLAHPELAERPQFDMELAFWIGQARRREYDEFRLRLAEWVAVCIPDDADAEHDQIVERRSATISCNDNGSYTLTAVFDPVSGAEFNNCFAHFREAFLHSDWADAEALHGTDTHPGHLARSERQRAVDALVVMARLAARNTNGADAGSDPGVVVVVDHDTFTHEVTRMLAGADDTLDARARLGDPDAGPPSLLPHQRRCRITNGPAVAPTVAVDAAIAGWVRYVMVNALGNPLAVSSKQRLFTGPLRDTVLQLSQRCIYPGCRTRAGACHADHRIEHARGGPTALHNLTPGPVCGTHNRYKALTGYLPAQDHDGAWHTYHTVTGQIVEPLL